jgi:acetyl esterase/lipase
MPSPNSFYDRSGLEQVVIPSSFTGTGHSEPIEYQVPTGYDPYGSPLPLMVCWHRFDQTCFSVALESDLDEECEARGWIYLAHTGVYQTHFGYPVAQIHCTKAIEYLLTVVEHSGVTGLNIDTSRIYMTGCSMGGGAALSYASRHLADGEGYPVAGLILVASLYDWTHAFYSNDPGVQYWLPYLLGGTPDEMPFAYKQISGLYMLDNTYVLAESMGRMARHQMPVFVTYADNDPIDHLIPQNEALIDLFDDSKVQANYVLDYQTNAPDPHNWPLLDIDSSFDFIEQYALEDQNTEWIKFLADREAKFYWVEVIEQTEADLFSEFSGWTDGVLRNDIIIDEASNMNELKIDCEWTGLDDSQDLLFQYQSSSGVEQVITFQPIATEPTYIVDGGGHIFENYTYDPVGEALSITRAPYEVLDLKVSFEPYTLTLGSDDEVPRGEYLQLELAGGQPFDPFILFLAFDQKETQVGNRHLLVHPYSPTFWFQAGLDSAGSLSLPLQVPEDPTLKEVTLFQQFVTYDTSLKALSNLDSTLIQ